jgi:hypothetical protein
MMRIREKRNRRPRRGIPRRTPRADREEPLRVLVQVLARQAAREHFEREIATQPETASEVTLH